MAEWGSYLIWQNNKHSHIVHSTMNIQVGFNTSQFVSNTFKPTDFTNTSIFIQSLLKNHPIISSLIQHNNTESNDFSRNVHVYMNGRILSASVISEKINVPHQEKLLFLDQ